MEQLEQSALPLPQQAPQVLLPPSSTRAHRVQRSSLSASPVVTLEQQDPPVQQVLKVRRALQVQRVQLAPKVQKETLAQLEPKVQSAPQDLPVPRVMWAPKVLKVRRALQVQQDRPAPQVHKAYQDLKD